MAVIIRKFIGPVPVDVVVRESHQSDLTISEHPVEFGAAVSDHAIVEPKRIVLDCIAGSRPGGVAAAAAAWQAIVALQEAREPFTVVTGLDVYPNMLIERLDADRDVRFGQVLAFTAALREVIIVDTETTEGAGSGTSQSGLSRDRLAPGSVRDRASPTVPRGNTAAQPVPPADAPRARSFLSSALGR